MRTISFLALSSFALFSCQSSVSVTPKSNTPVAAPMITPHGFDVSILDHNVKACDNFYDFATGNWKNLHPMPADRSRYGSFDLVADHNREALRTVLEEAAANRSALKGSVEQKIGDYFASCMAEEAIETEGMSSLAPELARIDQITDRVALQDEIARLQMIAGNVAFRMGSQQDFKDSTSMIGNLGQGGLGLPDRDYYTRDDDKSKKIREQYVEHIATMLGLIGESTEKAKSEAEHIMTLETALANASMTRVAQRDPNAVYHMMTVAEAAQLTPHFDWTHYFQVIGAPSFQRINVGMPDYFKAFDQLFAQTPLDDWKAYLRWSLVDRAAPTLAKKFVDADFDFSGRVLSGTPQNLPRWQRCVRAADTSLGQLVGQGYVKRYFPPEAKAHALELIDNLEAALKSDIPSLGWMSDKTKAQALAKLQAFGRKIGYPDRWRDYSALTLDRSSYAQNEMRARNWNFRRLVDRIGKPVDRIDWESFTPPTVNASYNPSKNEITFPAGILQPPFFDPNADDAYNYGGIGSVIGHEMSHGFDDQGSQFDREGNLVNWWSEEDLANFKARAGCVEQEFSSFAYEPGYSTQGKLVLGEAIADLGGVTIAYAAYERSLKNHPRLTIDGFTPEQRFFLGFAQVWGQQIRPEEARRRLLTDPHPLAQFRVNGTVSNLPEFAKAFGCAESSKMVREEKERCRIW